MSRRLIITLISLVIAGMVGLVSFSVPLYRLFCAVTGAGGTPQRVLADHAAVSARTVTVSFYTDVAPGLNWRFQPVQHSVTVPLGQLMPVFFTATNLADHAIVGHATFNVTPDKAGIYFKKVQCFCFAEERLAAHATVQMPVQFFVDPRLATDPATAEVKDITLSYEFFESRNPAGAQELARLDQPSGMPDARHGQALFAGRCAACHDLSRNRVGPALAGILGRTAGTRPGYPYSAALRQSAIVWTKPSLSAWLADPQADVAGSLMPLATPGAADRQDIIAFLATASAPSQPTPPP